MGEGDRDPMDATVGCLWAEGVADEILLFWQGQRLLALLSPIGLTIAGGNAGILQPSLDRGVAWPAHYRSVAYRAALNSCQRAINLRSAVVGFLAAVLSC